MVTVPLPVEVNVALDIVDASGVTSYNLPSKYISKNLSVPIATYPVSYTHLRAHET